MIADLEELLAPTSLDGLTTRPIAELRSLRLGCSEAESDVSLVRRLSQGRLDIVGHEVRRREGATDLEADLSGLLFDLPEILSADQTPSSPSSRPVSITDPGQVALQLAATLDGIASPADLAGIKNRRDGELRELFERIRSFEVELSALRRRLHERIDAIQAEIGRRYRDGEASVDSLLS